MRALRESEKQESDRKVFRIHHSRSILSGILSLKTLEAWRSCHSLGFQVGPLADISQGLPGRDCLFSVGLGFPVPILARAKHAWGFHRGWVASSCRGCPAAQAASKRRGFVAAGVLSAGLRCCAGWPLG